MSDPDCCPACGTFLIYHDDNECARAVHNENEEIRRENAQLRAEVERLNSKIDSIYEEQAGADI